MNSGLIPFIVIAIAVIIFVIFYLLFFKVWLKANSNGLNITLANIIAMRLRKVNCDDIVDAAIMLKREGVGFNFSELESLYLAGGRVKKVAEGLVAAKRADVRLEFNTAVAIELAGRDVVHSVKDCLTPKTFETDKVKAETKNGDKITANAKLIVKADINKMISGESIDILLEFITNIIVEKINSADSKNTVLSNLDTITNGVLDEARKKSTAYEIQELKILLN